MPAKATGKLILDAETGEALLGEGGLLEAGLTVAVPGAQVNLRLVLQLFESSRFSIHVLLEH